MKIRRQRLLDIIREELNLSELGLGLSFKQIEYTAFVLDEKSRSSLLAMVSPIGWTPLAHHMTLISPHENKVRMSSRWLNFEGCFRVTRLAQNDRVITGLVDLGTVPIPFKGPAFPHVTLAVNPETGGKPMMSNEFTLADFEPISSGAVKICGRVQEIFR